MAMLAEPRRKKQRITDDPNNLKWAKDSNKIGQKLLEKMGWKNGSGLGVNGQGRQNPLAVSSNAGTRGFGCSSNADLDVHAEHRRNFDQLLKSLKEASGDSGSNNKPSCEVGSAASPCSITELSKASRRRIHYSKFARGKELATASTADLATVTGEFEGRGRTKPIIINAADLESPSNITQIDEEIEIDQIRKKGKKKTGSSSSGFTMQAFVKASSG